MTSTAAADSPELLSSASRAALDPLRAFFAEHVPAVAPGSLTPETALLGTGLLDSLAVIQLMVFLGDRLGIEIADEDFVPENLATVGSLLAFIARKQGAGA
jgi:acyl carrier protein